VGVSPHPQQSRQAIGTRYASMAHSATDSHVLPPAATNMTVISSHRRRAGGAILAGGDCPPLAIPHVPIAFSYRFISLSVGRSSVWHNMHWYLFSGDLLILPSTSTGSARLPLLRALPHSLHPSATPSTFAHIKHSVCKKQHSANVHPLLSSGLILAREHARSCSPNLLLVATPR
jgi:hypothetical protein